MMTEQQFRIPDIVIARDGVWYSDGLRVIHQKIFTLFNENLHQAEDGSYYLEIRGQRCPVRVENTPFVVRTVFYENDALGQDILWLVLNSGTRQPLAPETLHIMHDNELRCCLDNGMVAGFSRQAATQLGPYLETDGSGTFFLELSGRKYIIRSRSRE